MKGRPTGRSLYSLPMAYPNPGGGRRLLRDKRLYIAAFLIGAWAIGSVIARPFYDRLNEDDEDERASPTPAAGENFVELAPLVAASTRIVIATFESETSGAGETPLVRTFTIVESLKGGGNAAATLEVWGAAASGPDDALALEAGTNYLLFLVEREFDGTSRWARPGEPSAAVVGDEGALEFVVSDRYAADMLKFGWVAGEKRVPFNATLAGVKTLAGAP